MKGDGTITVSTPHGGLATEYLFRASRISVVLVSTPHGGLATYTKQEFNPYRASVSTPHGGLATGKRRA